MRASASKTWPDTPMRVCLPSEIPALRADTTRRAFLRMSLALLGTAPLAGCFGNKPAMMAKADSLAANPILHVLTTRKLAKGGQASPFLDSARSSQLLYAHASLSAPESSMLNTLSMRSRYGVEKLDVQPSGVLTLAETLRGRDTLLFIHGYNQTFEAAARDAVQLSEGTGFTGNTALFSWASRGGLLDYGYDRESALLARDPLAELLETVLQDEFAGKLHLVAHSMGTLVTLEALRAYRDRHKDNGLEHLGALVLASPDIDADVFRAHLGRLGRWRDKITVITATNDRALSLSQTLAGGARVGALPREALEGLGVRIIDATDFAAGLIRHDAFVADADVRAAIQRAIQRS